MKKVITRFVLAVRCCWRAAVFRESGNRRLRKLQPSPTSQPSPTVRFGAGGFRRGLNSDQSGRPMENRGRHGVRRFESWVDYIEAIRFRSAQKNTAPKRSRSILSGRRVKKVFFPLRNLLPRGDFTAEREIENYDHGAIAAGRMDAESGEKRRSQPRRGTLTVP
jgi:hypothetical protein